MAFTPLRAAALALPLPAVVRIPAALSEDMVDRSVNHFDADVRSCRGKVRVMTVA
jgi:hypothetical protein